MPRLVALAVVAVLLVGCGYAVAPRAAVMLAPVLAVAAAASPPPGAAHFISAHQTGDAAAAAAVASPLLAAELRRRDRSGAWPFLPLWREAAPRLAFVHVGTMTDRDGFARALFTSTPAGRTGPVGLWRIDLDPSGAVIWGEPVRFFGEQAVRPVSAPYPAEGTGPASLALPPPLRDQPRGLLIGARAEAGDAYYALGLGGGARPAAVVLFGVDERGAQVPDYWSFGGPVPVQADDGARGVARPFLLDRDTPDEATAALLRAYLSRLW